LIKQLMQLKKLQDIDLILRDAVIEINRIKESIRKNDLELEELKERVKQLQSELKEKELKRKNMENEIRADEEVVKRWENRSKEIKSGREYQALMREISLTKKDISDKENEVLVLMEEIEKQQKELDGLNSILSEKNQKWISERDELEKKISEDENKIKENNIKKEEVMKSLSQSLLQRYERIKSQREGIAIVEARNYICTGCNMNIPPQVYNQVLRRETLVSCPYCQRLLFIPEEETVNA
jgi:predicted  nucleic acid-binding Zn-ribbon protein